MIYDTTQDVGQQSDRRLMHLLQNMMKIEVRYLIVISSGDGWCSVRRNAVAVAINGGGRTWWCDGNLVKSNKFSQVPKTLHHIYFYNQSIYSHVVRINPIDKQFINEKLFVQNSVYIQGTHMM